MADQDIVGSAPSRRDQNRRRTRDALRTAALDLFSTQGYDATTTEQIAERGGVAVRTFFRYFPTKESVLYIGETDWINAVIAALGRQPDSLDDLEAVRLSILETLSRLARIRDGMISYNRAVASSSTLRGRAQDHQRKNAGRVAEALAQRHHLDHPDSRDRLTAEVALLTYRQALHDWLEGPESGDLFVVMAHQFDLLREVVGGDGGPTRDRSG